MKTRLALILGLPALALSVWLWFHLTGAGDISLPPKPGPVAPALPPPTTTQTDTTEVFQRAFWKRPTETDRILHAERREWADEDGVDRWQWFIAVDPSEELQYYLKEQNPFGMAAPDGAAAMPSEPRPEWFPKSANGHNAWQTSDGQMLLLIDPQNGRIHASGEGRGFAKPVEVAPAPNRPARQTTPPRLPTTPPPTPPEP